jgi:hypothetical protein
VTEIRLPDLRIGFGYAADLNFPPGFLQVDEDVRAALRRYPGQHVPDAVFRNTRVGDTVTIELTGEQTRELAPGTYLTEAIIYYPANPGEGEIALVDNQFRIEANWSPSGPDIPDPKGAKPWLTETSTLTSKPVVVAAQARQAQRGRKVSLDLKDR